MMVRMRVTGLTHEPVAPAAPADPDRSDVARWLQDVRPEDFGPGATA